MNANYEHTEAPWKGFWFNVASLIRTNIIFVFAIIWFGLSHVHVYFKVLFIVLSIVLDRIAVRRSIDTEITTISDFCIYAKNIVEKKYDDVISKHKKQLIAIFRIYLLLVITEVCFRIIGINNIHIYNNVFVFLYGILGFWFLYTESTNPFIRATEQQLNNAAYWGNHTFFSGKQFVLKLRFIQFLLITPPIFIISLFVFLIGTPAAYEQPFQILFIIKFAITFFVLCLFLTIHMALPLDFKGAAYAEWLQQHDKFGANK